MLINSIFDSIGFFFTTVQHKIKIYKKENKRKTSNTANSGHDSYFHFIKLKYISMHELLH